MGAQENKFQISQELRKQDKIVMHNISLIFVKFKAFEVCFLRLPKELLFGVISYNLLHL